MKAKQELTSTDRGWLEHLRRAADQGVSLVDYAHAAGMTLMGRRSTTGGITTLGSHRIQFDFTIDGVRYLPTLPWVPNEANLRRAREYLLRIKARIRAGTFCFAEEFPDFRGLHAVRLPLSAQSCGDIFNAFLHHEEARVARNDLASTTLASHRQILDHVWRPHIGKLPFLGVRYSTLVKVVDAHRWNKKTYNNAISALRRAFEFGYRDHPEQHNPARFLKSARIGKKDRPVVDPFSIQDAENLIAKIHRDWGEAQGNYDELRFFTGLRPSEQIALVATDFDRANGVLSVTKARVAGIDRDMTKTAEDRRVVLCPRARRVLERQLRLREQMQRDGRIKHDFLFFAPNGEPIRHLREVYSRWRRSLRSLAIRYRKPYAARHSSVSWSLMMERNPLWVCKQHGHSILTMLRVYAAWTEGARSHDVAAIRRAMRASPTAEQMTRELTHRPIRPSPNSPVNLPIADARRAQQKAAQHAIGSGRARPDLATGLPIEKARRSVSLWRKRRIRGGEGGIRMALAGPSTLGNGSSDRPANSYRYTYGHPDWSVLHGYRRTRLRRGPYATRASGTAGLGLCRLLESTVRTGGFLAAGCERV